MTSSPPSRTSFLKGAGRAVRRLLRVVTRPVRRDRSGLDGVVIQPYRGYGSADGIYLMGRVFRQPTLGAGLPSGTFLRELADLARRLARWGLGDVRGLATFGGATVEFTTDADGYFEIELAPEQLPDEQPGWHAVHLEVTRNGEGTEEDGLVYLAPDRARRVVVSDIDDTVMHTGVADRIRMLWRLFMQGAESRVALPGVPTLYRGLHDGPSGAEGNPMLYVSRAPWSIYEVLETFFRTKQIPEGPILFLREWGLTLQHPLPKKSEDHKRDLIEGMLERYDELPFVLIGDSGQHDPEVYADVVRRHPGRIEAVYIRDVSRADARREEIERLAAELDEAGAPLLLASTSREMAEHAADLGLVAPEVPGRTEAERAAEVERAGGHARAPAG